jgi:hypothetical protein
LLLRVCWLEDCFYLLKAMNSWQMLNNLLLLLLPAIKNKKINSYGL